VYKSFGLVEKMKLTRRKLVLIIDNIISLLGKKINWMSSRKHYKIGLKLLLVNQNSSILNFQF
ncbi:MAG: hypothetical protein Q8L04_01895, partial [Ignavibacteria bacterium]|nr:hypothetical protein [Ignavibacteria bacterium]